jgi:hypothetical protein
MKAFQISRKELLDIFYLIAIGQHNHCRLTYYITRDKVKNLIINIH